MLLLLCLVSVLVVMMILKGAEVSMGTGRSSAGQRQVYENPTEAYIQKEAQKEEKTPQVMDRKSEEEELWEQGEKVNSDIVAARYSYVWKRYQYMDVKEEETRIKTEKLCLDRKKRWCWESALLARREALPSCVAESIHVRSTFIYRNQSVSIVEISKAMAATSRRSIFCPNAEPARIKFFTLTAYLNREHRYLTHTLAFIKCWADSEQHPNAQGLIILNYLGNCSWPVPNQPLTLTLSSPTHGLLRKTSSIFLPTPISRSFMQQFPSLSPKVISQGLLPVPDRLASVPFQYTLCALAAVIDTDAPFFNHWLWHVKNRVKVQHITMYYQPDSFHLDSPHINASFVQELIETGFLHLVPWYSHYKEGTQVFYRSQVAAYNDYIYRFRGMCLWTMFADVDDFFVSWKTGHQLVPVIADVLRNNSAITSLRMAWPPLMPRCQKLTGFQAPYNSDFLSTIRYGTLNFTHLKYVDMGVDKNEVSIHYSQSRNSTSVSAPGVAVYHVRAGHPRLVQRNQYSRANCSKSELKGWDLKARAEYRFPYRNSFDGSPEVFGKIGIHGFD
jgi:hypothetical protein